MFYDFGDLPQLVFLNILVMSNQGKETFMNSLKTLALLTVLATASVLPFAQNANAWVIFGHEDHYGYDRHHDREWNRRREIEWRREHERWVRERRDHHDRDHHDHYYNH
jgi:hypothetical protein